MDINNSILQASFHLRQRRYPEAEKELRQYLSGDPEHIGALQMLTQCLYEQADYAQALEINDQAMRLSPNNDEVLAQRGQILFFLEREPEAVQMLEQAIQLNPVVAGYRGFLGEIKLAMKDYSGALETANEGLALDPEHSYCLNIRAKALVKLERPEEAHSTIATALEQDPENSYTHSNLGWSLLESGQGQHALPHFREALRLDPTNEYAQAGMQEAIKANNWFYRMFLRYVFWMNRMSAQYQWGFIIGIYVAYRVLLNVAQNSPSLAPILYPVLYLYIAFALSTWFFTPISNLFLFLHRDGRYLLDHNEKVSARFVGIAAGLSIAILLTHFLGDWDHEGYLMLGLATLAMMIPYAVMLSPSETKDRRLLVVGAILLSLGWAWAGFHVLIGQHDMADSAFTFVFLGIFGYQFLANAKMTPRY